ncbi:glycoside hydrolase family 3 protein [Cristinia sonorae]|uniref:beta-glucosidase n=1 Tax=Cristinia sonorae TaxID=1940300 RepID=A0A8K0XNC4_9AGAR|nr:glycoside hydrolase family 3 protein [Cristinia sonorae]
MSSKTDFDVEKTLSKLTLRERITLLAGRGWWHMEPIKGKVRSLRMSDGPNGVRGTQFFNGTPSSCFPCSTGLASTFDVELAQRIGKALAVECAAKGVHVLLAPTVNTQRSPLGGRGFESFSEDPLLNGKMASHYINGLQSKGVAATIKHFVANDQEFERFSISSEVSHRALREIYMKPFQIAIRESNPWALMTSYNRLNGLHASEHSWLLQDVLREEWGYKGSLMSDWTGTYSTVEAINAGLDLEMPGPSVVRGPALIRALQSEKLFPTDIEVRARKVLELVKYAEASSIEFDKKEASVDNPEMRALLRRAAASSVVILKNSDGLLPIEVTGDNLILQYLHGQKPDMFKFMPSFAVIGPNAKHAMISGGGSAALSPTYMVSPLQGIEEAASHGHSLKDDQVKYSLGLMTQRYTPLVDPHISLPSGSGPGGKFEFWNKSPNDSFLSTGVDLSEKLPDAAWNVSAVSAYAFLADGIPDDKVDEVCWIRWTSVFTPDESGEWMFGLGIAGRGNLFVNNTLVVDLSTEAPQGDLFFGLGTIEKRGKFSVETGKQYTLEVRLSNAEFMQRDAPFTTRGGMRVGAYKYVDEDKGIEEAVRLATVRDVAVLVVGLNHDYESEGFDRPNMDLPGRTNELVTKVLKANPRTIIVVQSGTPVKMPWIKEANTVVQAFYGGNETGHGLADVLFGKVNPSAKLPLTFPKRLRDSPAHPSFSSHAQERGKVHYNEGIFVGYRGFEINDIAPLFPFGFGLSYTTYTYSSLSLPSTTSDGNFTVKFKIKNTGYRDGKEIVQVYVTDVESSLPRPVKELAGFTKVSVNAGEEADAEVTLDVTALSFWESRQGTWIAEKGDFDVIVAASSAKDEKNLLKGRITLTKTITWTGLGPTSAKK